MPRQPQVQKQQGVCWLVVKPARVVMVRAWSLECETMTRSAQSVCVAVSIAPPEDSPEPPSILLKRTVFQPAVERSRLEGRAAEFPSCWVPGARWWSSEAESQRKPARELSTEGLRLLAEASMIWPALERVRA